jgi:Variant SH3 domain
MYDYEATCDEELTFEEGTVLRVLRKDVHSVDDGWWEGEMITDEGKSVTGLFPSLVIQECGPDGEPLSGEVRFCKLNLVTKYKKLQKSSKGLLNILY